MPYAIIVVDSPFPSGIVEVLGPYQSRGAAATRASMIEEANQNEVKAVVREINSIPKSLQVKRSIVAT